MIINLNKRNIPAKRAIVCGLWGGVWFEIFYFAFDGANKWGCYYWNFVFLIGILIM